MYNIDEVLGRAQACLILLCLVLKVHFVISPNDASLRLCKIATTIQLGYFLSEYFIFGNMPGRAILFIPTGNII